MVTDCICASSWTFGPVLMAVLNSKSVPCAAAFLAYLPVCEYANELMKMPVSTSRFLFCETIVLLVAMTTSPILARYRRLTLLIEYYTL
jgi:hypothetical protein